MVAAVKLLNCLDSWGGEGGGRYMIQFISYPFLTPKAKNRGTEQVKSGRTNNALKKIVQVWRKKEVREVQIFPNLIEANFAGGVRKTSCISSNFPRLLASVEETLRAVGEG